MLGPRAGDAYAQASGPSWPELARLQRALQQYRQIAINLERSRQVFTAARGDFLLVNIPAFEASLVRDGNTVWTTRVVVGEVGGPRPRYSKRSWQPP
jgi:murein L,D-transpeptidase YcbB/YkuD